MRPPRSASKRGNAPTDEKGAPTHSVRLLFPIVGVGASAGGREAFTELLSHLPVDTGMGLVLIQHLAPRHEGMLTEALSRTTRLPVAEVKEGMEVQANHVYIIPPKADMAIERGALHLIPRPSQRGQQMPIDHFLASLAKDRGDGAIGVILSGAASDGTLGLKAIKAEGGVTFAQNETAKYDSMPKSAIAAGCVDYILPPREIANELARIGRHRNMARPGVVAKVSPVPEDDLGKILLWLRCATGVDFSQYKKATFIRRIKRRMVLRNMETLAEYVAVLHNSRAELDALFRDMLINITSVLREPETFETLKRGVFPAPKDDPVAAAGQKETGRASKVLALNQQLDQNGSELQDVIEQFAMGNEELRNANEGIKPNNQELRSTNEELETAKEELQATNEELTTLNEELRNRNLDLSVSNRDLNNVISTINIPILIVDRDLRIRRMNPSAETMLNLIPADVGRPITNLRTTLDFPDLEALVFDSIQSSSLREREVKDRRGHWHSLRIRPYMTGDDRIEGAVITLVDISTVKAEAIGARSYAEGIVETVRESVLVLDAELRVKAANRAFYETFLSTPADTLDRLLPELGNGQWNLPELLEMLREMLPKHKEVREFKIEYEFAGLGRRTMLVNAIQMKRSGDEPKLTLLAITDYTERERAMEVLEEQSKLLDLAHDAIIVRSPGGVIRLWNRGAATLYGWTREEALGKITHHLLKTRFPEPLEEVERKLMNQGEWSGELIHTSRGGKQIVVASRHVLHRRDHGQADAILEINRDITQSVQAEAFLQSSEARLRALVSSMDDIVFEVDSHGRRLSAWTGNPGVLARSHDKQRAQSIEDFLPAQSFLPLREAIERVIKENKPESVEYSLDLDGSERWFVARINRIAAEENAPPTLSVLVREITPRKTTEIALQQSEERFRLLVEGVKDYAIFALDTEGRIVSWNSGAERIKGYDRDEIIGKHFSVFYPPEDVAAGKPEKHLQIAATQGRFEDAGGWSLRKDGSRFFAHLVISAIRDKDGTLRGFTKITRDITDRMRAEEAVRQLSGHILRLQDEERRRIARDLHDSTAQLLTALSMNLSLAARRPGVAGDKQASKLIKESEALANQASDEVRNTSHLLHPPDLDAVGLVAAIRWHAARFSERTGIAVKLSLPDEMCRLPQDNEIALFRVMQESLTNVQRHSGSKVVRIRIRQHNDVVDLQIDDKGRGIPDGVLGHEQQSAERLGVGIAGMRERLKQLGGRLEILSSPRGTKVKAIVPCPPDEPSKGSSAEPR